MRPRLATTACAAILLIWTPAQAAVKLKFEMFSSGVGNLILGYTGGFEVTVPNVIDVVDITNAMTPCHKVLFGQPTPCGNTFLMRQEGAAWARDNWDAVSFSQQIYFAPGTFNTPGTHDSIILGPADHSRARLTVTGVADPIPKASAVPEPAGWAVLLAGFGLAGFQLRRRHQYTPPVFQSPSGPMAPL